jgi:hypothetical protein
LEREAGEHHGATAKRINPHARSDLTSRNVSHGWPGSPIEQLKIIDPLTNPRLTAPARRTPSTS